MVEALHAKAEVCQLDALGATHCDRVVIAVFSAEERALERDVIGWQKAEYLRVEPERLVEVRSREKRVDDVDRTNLDERRFGEHLQLVNQLESEAARVDGREAVSDNLLHPVVDRAGRESCFFDALFQVRKRRLVLGAKAEREDLHLCERRVLAQFEAV